MLKIYPVKHEMRLTVFSTENSNAEITIFDNNGRKIGQQSAQIINGVNNIESMLLSDRPPGLYRVIVVTGKNRYANTVLVVK
jgi:hypothetical protein